MLRPTWVSIPGSAFRFAYGAFTLFDRLSQHRSATESVCNSPIPLRQVPDRPLNTPCATPAGLTRKGFRLYPFRSPLLRASLRFLLLRLLRCFTSPGDRLHRGDWAQHPAGFPHSEICGSMVACTSPQLIAACHVLLRPQAPRHSPCALSTLTPITSSLLPSARFRLSRSSWSPLYPTSVNERVRRIRFSVLPSPFSGGLLRKEVIQPHLPVRLPCYDFTPLTRRTFDGSLPYGLSLRLRVPPTRVV